MIIPQCSAQMFSSTIPFEATVPVNTITVGIGKTEVSGYFYGINMSEIISIPSLDQYQTSLDITNLTDTIDLSFFDSLYGFPLFAPIVFSSVSEVLIINNSIFNNPPSSPIELQQFIQDVEIFENVTISVDQGLAFFGTNGQKVSMSSSASFALSGFAELPVFSKNDFDTFFLLSMSPRLLHYSENTSMLYPFSPSTLINIISSEGSMLWNQSGTDSFLLIKHDRVTITDESPLHLYPLSSNKAKKNYSQLEMEITPAEQQDINIDDLLSSLSKISTAEENISIPFDILKNNMLRESLSSVSPMMNGAFLLVDRNETVVIDGRGQFISSFVFVRSKKVSISIDDNLPFVKKISSQGDLFFVNDYFFVQSAKDSENGLYLPILPIIVWVGALLCFLLLKYNVIRKKEREYVEEITDKKISLALIGIRLLSIGIIFFLLDFEVKQLLGTSAFHMLFNHFFWPIFLLLLGFQLVLWFIGYLCCAFPLQYLIITSFNCLPINKTYRKTMGKSIGLLGIWLFAGLYMLLVLNIILFFIKPLLPSLPMV
ncbi:MAG: hypothetical protein R6U21_06910 [Thermoplasmatota archaeon]